MSRAGLPAELRRYHIGAKIRRLRLRKKISLEELGRHTSLSPALLSKLERDQVMPTLPTLVRVALVFGVGLDELFTTTPPGAAVVRAGERLRFPERQDDPDSGYDFESLDYETSGREMSAYLAEFRSGAQGRDHAHDAAEFLFLLTGSLVVRVEGADHVLEAGDAIYIRSGVPHAYIKAGDLSCRALVVTAAAPTAAIRPE